MLWFVRAFGRHAEIVGLFVRELRQLHTDAVEVQAGDFLVEMRSVVLANRAYKLRAVDPFSLEMSLYEVKLLAFENGVSARTRGRDF